MIFNFTIQNLFTTQLTLNNNNLEVVNEAKLLGVILTNDLKWDKNTEYIKKKSKFKDGTIKKGFTVLFKS